MRHPDGTRTAQLFGGKRDGEVFALPSDDPYFSTFRVPVMSCQVDLWKSAKLNPCEDIAYKTETYEWDGTFTEEEHRRYRRKN